jgi:transposase-like protein
MIRWNTIFCKLDFNILSVIDLFNESMKEFSLEKLLYLNLPCPHCGAKSPIWNYHDSYSRYLIAFENNESVTYIIDIVRLICSSCEHTHAILPEVIIPHSSYSLIFIMFVLKDYFSKVLVKNICEKYQISVSQLYRWIHLFKNHKKLWLGILEDTYQKALDFISSLLNHNLSDRLKCFFTHTNQSFLQGKTKKAQYNSS